MVQYKYKYIFDLINWLLYIVPKFYLDNIKLIEICYGIFILQKYNFE